MWQQSGRQELLLQRLAEDLRNRSKIDLSTKCSTLKRLCLR